MIIFRNYNRIVHVSLLIPLLVITSFFSIFIYKKYSSIENDKQRLQIELLFVANQANLNSPIILNQFTIFNSAFITPDLSMGYNYTFLHKGSMNEQERILSSMKDSIKENILNNDSMKIFRENKVGLIYIYKNVEGKILYKFEVTKGDYVEQKNAIPSKN